MADDVEKKPKVRFHEGTSLKYLYGQEQVLFENGVVIARTEFDKLEKGGLSERLDELLKNLEFCNFDFAYACTTGYLRRKKKNTEPTETSTEKEKIPEKSTEKSIEKSTEPVPAPNSKETTLAEATQALLENAVSYNPTKSEPMPESPQETQKKKESKVEEQKNEAPRVYVFSSVFLVMIVMIAVGVGSAIMSAYHTSAFLIFGGKPTWTAILTGTMLILFSGTAFTAARHFLQEKGLQKIFGFMFIAAGFAVIVYSIFSTVTVNFNQFKWRDDEKAVVAVTGNEALASHNRLLQENREALDEANAKIVKIETDAEYWKTMSWKRYDEMQKQLADAYEDRAILRNRRIELEASKPELIAQAENSQETVYTFLARLLGLKEDVARFFVYVIPACLYDVLAPFALSVVLLLMDKRRKVV